jgi:hypothetical protein
MKAYKFLRPGNVAPFSEFVWPEDTWVEADAELETCRSGIHACRLDQLAYWLADELWEVEFDGEIDEQDLQVIAARGRLVRRVNAWDEAARREFAAACVKRTAAYAAEKLREHDLPAEADLLDAAEEPEQLAARAEEAAAAASRVVGAGAAADLAGYVADAAGYAKEGQTAGAAFVAAHAAFVQAPAGVTDPFTAEREGQAQWLARRLGLSEGGA